MYSLDVLRVEVQADPGAGLVNLVPDPNGMLGGAGYATASAAGTARLEGVGVVLPGSPEQVPALKYKPSPTKVNSVATEVYPITPGQWAAARVDVVEIASSATRATLSFTDAAGALVGTSGVSAWTTAVTTLTVAPIQAPAGAVGVRLSLIHAADTAGGIIAGPGTWMTLRGFTVAKAATSAALTPLPILPEPWVDVSSGTLSAAIPRRELGTSILDLQMMDAELDPATSTLIRPGRRVRVLAKSTDRAGGWDQLYGGKMLRGTGTYDYLAAEGKQVRVAITAVDTTQTLAAAQRPDGVATIDDLAAVLSGTGVLWKINGRTISYAPGSRTIVSRNDNATALDQVAITRDSRMGYAWVDRYGVLQINDADKMPTAIVATLDESVYGADNLEFDYDTDRCINSVAVKYLRMNPDTEDSEEVTYGPYVDQASIAEWGPHHVDVTVHGLNEDAGAIQAYATSILAANATPRLTVVGLQIPIRDPEDISDARALLDMYDLVTVTNAEAGYSETQRITALTHEITGDHWTLKVGFSAEGTIATPIATTPPPAATPTTLGQILRPVGEVTMWYGTKGAIPAGWLALDGSAFSGTTYPKLATLLGSTTLPDLTDRMPVGAGSKALGTTGGAATHTHPLSDNGQALVGVYTGGQVLIAQKSVTSHTSNVRTNGTFVAGGGTGSVGAVLRGATDAGDSLPPWRALWFIIRAR